MEHEKEMTKFITAKQALVLSNQTDELDEHINYINHQIFYAAQHGHTHAECVMWCEHRIMVKLTARLRAVGYYVSWHMRNDSCGYMIVMWGGS